MNTMLGARTAMARWLFLEIPPDAVLVACDASLSEDEPDTAHVIVEFSSGHLNSFSAPVPAWNEHVRDWLELSFAALAKDTFAVCH